MSEQENNAEGKITKRDNFTIEVKYSPEAIEKKLMRFTTKSGDTFEISAEEMIDTLVKYVNMDVLSPTFVDTERVNVVQVERQIEFLANEDIKKGSVFRAAYIHPYPLEFAILEEAWKIASIDEGRGNVVLTKEFIEEVKKKMQPNFEKMRNFAKKFYSSYQGLDIEKRDAKM